MKEYYPMNTGLPEGMEYDEQGNIIWFYEDKDRHMYFRLEKERICYKYLPLTNPKKILGINSSPYGKVIGLEFPDDELCRSFYDMKWIKEMRKKNSPIFTIIPRSINLIPRFMRLPGAEFLEYTTPTPIQNIKTGALNGQPRR